MLPCIQPKRKTLLGSSNFTFTITSHTCTSPVMQTNIRCLIIISIRPIVELLSSPYRKSSQQLNRIWTNFIYDQRGAFYHICEITNAPFVQVFHQLSFSFINFQTLLRHCIISEFSLKTLVKTRYDFLCLQFGLSKCKHSQKRLISDKKQKRTNLFLKCESQLVLYLPVKTIKTSK